MPHYRIPLINESCAIIQPAMLQFLGNDDTWRTLRSLSQHRNCPLYVAVPFLGDGASKLLHLKRGDVLVVALTIGNSRNGSVCPAEIERLQAKGVRVFLSPVLHAKVLLCGRKVVVGSANLSQTSFSVLDEAAMLTTDAKIVKHVRAWFQQRTLQEVSPKWLGVCAKAWRPPRGGFGPQGRRITRPVGSAVWLVGLTLTDYPEDEAAFEERGAAQAKRELSDPSTFKVEPVRFAGESSFLAQIGKGDTIIQVMESADSRSHYVEELARLIGKRKTKSRRGFAVTYLFLESRKRPIRMPWGKFKRECFAFGLKLKSAGGTRQIKNPAQAAKVLSLVSRR
jgi:hypothetical protein